MFTKEWKKCTDYPTKAKGCLVATMNKLSVALMISFSGIVNASRYCYIFIGSR